MKFNVSILIRNFLFLKKTLINFTSKFYILNGNRSFVFRIRCSFRIPLHGGIHFGCAFAEYFRALREFKASPRPSGLLSYFSNQYKIWVRKKNTANFWQTLV